MAYADPKVQEHYVAVVEIKRVRVTTSTAGVTPAVNREKTNIARVVIANEDLEALKMKIGDHIDLVEDGGEVDV